VIEVGQPAEQVDGGRLGDVADRECGAADLETRVGLQAAEVKFAQQDVQPSLPGEFGVSGVWGYRQTVLEVTPDAEQVFSGAGGLSPH
jgi:hypothetical protein